MIKLLLIGDQSFFEQIINNLDNFNNGSSKGLPENLIKNKLFVAEIAASKKQAEEILKNPQSSIDIVVLGPGISDQECREIFTEFTEKIDSLVNTPTTTLLNTNSGQTNLVFIWPSELSHQEVCALNFYSKNLFNKYLPKDDPRLSEILENAIKSTIEELKEEGNKLFNLVSIERILEYNYVNCDVFLKLSDAKYVKIIKATEFYSRDIIENYIKKGVKYLYVRLEDYMVFTEYIYKNIRSKFKMSSKSLKDNVENGIEALSVVKEVIRSFKIDKETMQIITETADQCMSSIKSYSKLKDLLDIFIDTKGYLQGHSILLSYVTNLISLRMSWFSPLTLQKLSLAALLHDLTLSDERLARVNDLSELTYDKFTIKEMNIVKKHPQNMIEILSEIKDFPPDVTSIILTHHEKLDGSGFPRGLQSNQFSQIGALFIIAEDFVNRIYDRPQLDSTEIYTISTEFQRKYNSHNLRGPCEGLLKLLNDIL